MSFQSLVARLVGRQQRPVRPVGTVGRRQRAYAIGDIHGRADLLLRIHDSIRRDAERAPVNTKMRVVYLGDYIDRGLHSKEVLTILLEQPLEGFEAVYLKGNHEDLLLRFFEDAEIGPTWFALGGAATASSYGVSLRRNEDEAPFESLQRRMRQALPKAHMAFLKSLKPMYVLGDYIFVHAGIRPGVAHDRQRVEDMLWIRDDFLEHEAALDKIVVHGHSISHEPEIRKYRIGIDTGAYATNRLSCLILDEADHRLISTTQVSHKT